MHDINEEITYFTPNEVSKAINELAERCEYAKLLQANLATLDNDSVRNLESEIASTKWAIADYLSDQSNYENWKNFDNNNSEMLTKYVQKNYFEHEFEGTKLKEKIIRDFSEQYKANPEASITKREKFLVKHYEDNNVPIEKRTFLVEHDAVVAGIYQQDKCFQKHFATMLKELPKKLSKDVVKCIDTAKNNPTLLKDNPYHYVVNRGLEAVSVTCNQLKEIIEDANLNDSSATVKLAKVQKGMDEMNKATTNKKLAEDYRKKMLGTDKSSSKKDI